MTGITNREGRRIIGEDIKRRVVELARAGRSAYSIAKECGIAPSSVTRICAKAEPPITFDRKATKEASAAKREDSKSRRARIAEGFLDDVETLRTQLFAERMRVHYSVTSGKVEYTSPPTPGEIRDLSVSAGVLLDKHLAVIKVDSDDRDLPTVDKWIAWTLSGEGQ